jgi:hypothetical protein
MSFSEGLLPTSGFNDPGGSSGRPGIGFTEARAKADYVPDKEGFSKIDPKER